MADQVRWFEEFGNCSECLKPATGILRGPQNESYGKYCSKCAGRRLKNAKAEREKEVSKCR